MGQLVFVIFTNSLVHEHIIVFKFDRGGATLELGGAMAPPNFFNSPLELVKKNYKLLKLHVNLFTGPPKF